MSRIEADHLAREAIVYVRQGGPFRTMDKSKWYWIAFAYLLDADDGHQRHGLGEGIHLQLSFALLKFAPLRSAPLRSGRMDGFSALRSFQTSTPCRRSSRCSGLATRFGPLT